MKKSLKHGKSISDIEIQDISPHGIWILVLGREYFLSYNQFPWFKNASHEQVRNVELLHGNHLSWKELDVDLHIDSLEDPDSFPLISSTHARIKK